MVVTMNTQSSPDLPETSKIIVRRRVASYCLTAIIFAVLYYVLRDSQWRGSVVLHTSMETIASLLAITVGLLSIYRYHAGKADVMLLVIGAGFIGTGLLDGYHMVVTSVWVKDSLPSELSSLIPWSWVASRLFLAAMMVLAWATWRRTTLLGDSHGITPQLVYSATILLTIICGMYFAFIPLPPAYYPELYAHRPEEFVPGVLFVLALYLFIKKGDWKTDIFEHWLVVSLIINVIAQVIFMPYSLELFDMQFDVAHALKKVAYVCALTGLLMTHRSYATNYKLATGNR